MFIELRTFARTSKGYEYKNTNWSETCESVAEQIMKHWTTKNIIVVVVETAWINKQRTRMQVQSSHLSVLALPLSALGSPRWLGFKQLPNRLPYKNRQKHYSSMEPNGTKRIQARSQAKSLQIGCNKYNFNNLYQASRSCRRLIPCMAVSATKGHDKKKYDFWKQVSFVRACRKCQLMCTW